MKVIYLVMNKISYCLPSVHCALRLFLLLSFWSLDEQCIGKKLYCQLNQIWHLHFFDNLVRHFHHLVHRVLLSLLHPPQLGRSNVLAH